MPTLVAKLVKTIIEKNLNTKQTTLASITFTSTSISPYANITSTATPHIAITKYNKSESDHHRIPSIHLIATTELIPNASSVNYNYHELFEPIPQIPVYIRITTLCCCIAILLLGIIGNIMVPIIIIRTKDMRNSTNIFLINLSIADLLVLLICTPTVLVELNSKPETWILGHEMCKAVPFVELTVAHASVLTILAISFERYYAICQPLKAGYVCTKTRATLICILAWGVAALFTSPILWMAEYKLMDYVDGSLVAVCLTQAIFTWTISYFLMITMVFFFLPLVILIVLYGIIARNLISNRGRMIRLRLTKPEMSLKARKQVILMLGAVVISFFFCLIPFRLLTLWIMLSPNQSIPDMGFERYYNVLYFSRIMLYLNSAINPILYNLMSTKFRKGFYQMICSTWSHILTSITCNHNKKSKAKRAEATSITNTTNATNTTSSTTGVTSQAASSVLSSKHQSHSNDEECPKCHLNISCGPNSELKAILHEDESNCTTLKAQQSINEHSCFVLSYKDAATTAAPTAAPTINTTPYQQVKQSNLISNSRLKIIEQINIDEDVECEEDQISADK